MHVSAPASSANLGPGFDSLALALELPFELVTAADAPEGLLAAESTHPAVVAFVAAGGDPDVELCWRSPIPPGRGLGFSGAARVAGAHLAGVLDGLDDHTARRGAFVVASELEGHADNAAASAFGGLAVTAGDEVVSVPVPPGLQIVTWSPESTTSTDRSRTTLPEVVPLDDVVFSLGRAALWVAAVATGELEGLRTACQDRLHQPSRLAARDDAREVLEHLLGLDVVLAAWLSGSGPTIAALVGDDSGLDPESMQLPAAGRVRSSGISRSGSRVVEGALR